MKLKSLPLPRFFVAVAIPLLVLLASVPAWSNPISVKQHPAACVDSGAANSKKCSFSSNTTVGNFIWVSASAYPGNNSQNPNCTVSDDGRDSFTAAANNGEHTGGGGWVYVWGAQVATAGTGVTVSCTPTSGSTMFITLDIFELTVGSSASWTFPDKGNGATGSGGGTTLSVASFTPSNGNEIVVAAATTDNSEAFSAGTNFTLGSNVTSGQPLGTEYWVQGTATATTAPIKIATSDNWAEVATSISASGGSTAPSITSLSPTSGPVGTSVTINGSNLGSSSSGNTVTFNGTAATTTSWNSTQIMATVPSGATSGPVVVTVGGNASRGVNFTVTPHITSLSPTSGLVGASVTIAGTTFGSSSSGNAVTFNGTAATTTSWNSTQIMATVPSGATTGNVVVMVGGNASNSVSFTVTSPNISSLSATSGPVGTSVTINGNNLGSSSSGNAVTFNGTAATTASWTSTQIMATVPSGATTGNVVVTVGGNASNGVSFTVTPNITSLSLTSGPVGTSVTITGTTFGTSSGNTVTFNGTAATITSWNSGQIVAVVPATATSGLVVVKVGGNASNGVNFTVTPAITSLSPTSGQVGASVTINGTSLGSSSGNTVTFNGKAATTTTWTGTQIGAAVPSGATSGPVVVTVGGNASNGVSFTVTPPSAPLRTGTFFVNRTDDPQVPVDTTTGNPLLAQFCQNTSATDTSTPCSLREAVVEANGDVNDSNTSPDTIMLQAGTYHLNQASTGFAPLNATTGHLDITSPMTIVGAGNSGSSITTINADSALNDQVFLIDNADGEFLTGFPVAIRNLVIQNGKANEITGTETSGGVVTSGGAFEWEAGTDGNGQLQLTNVTITANTATDSNNVGSDDGGGIALFNIASTTPGQVNISGSLISGNHASDSGGGIALKGAVSLTMSNSTVTGNFAQNGTVLQGGGLFLCVCGNPPTGATSTLSQIHNSTISTNTAGSGSQGEGGGIWTNQSLTIDQGSFIQGNTGGGAGGGVATVLAATSDQLVITSSTITGNITSGNGGGIEVDSGSSASLQLQFNRIVGNTAGSDTGLANEGTGTISATENWWGCDQGPSTSPCDTVGGTGTIAFTPWLDLTNTASPGTVLNGAATTLTAGFLLDSSGAAVAASNLGALIGQPVSWINPVNGSLSNQQATIQPNGTATATLTTSATVTPGITTLTASAQATVDNVTCQGFSGNCPSQASVNVQDFNIGVSPPQTVNVGSTGTVSYTVTVSAISGFNGTVTLSCTNPPAGIQCTFTPPSLTGSGTSTLTATIPSAPGPNSIPVTGTSPGLQPKTKNASLTVADFAVSILPPSAVTATAPQSGSYTVQVSSNSGYVGTISLSVQGLSSSATATFTGTQVNLTAQNTSGTQGLSISAPPASTPYTFTVVGTSQLNVPRSSNQGQLTVRGFAVSVSPNPQTITPGGNANYTVTVSSISGYSGTVNLTCTGSNSVITVSCPASVSVPSGGSATATMNASVSSAATPGSFSVTAQGTDPATNEMASGSAGLTVPDFGVSLSPPSATVTQGSSVHYSVSLSSSNGFAGSVQLTCSDSASGVTMNCPASATVPTSFSITANTNASTPAGNSTVTVTASTSGFSRSATATLTTRTPATGFLGIEGYITCNSTDGGPVCDAGTFTVSVTGPGNVTLTKVVDYNGVGLSGTTADGDTSFTIAQNIANAFNSDPQSPITANPNGLPNGPFPSCSAGNCTSVGFSTIQTGSGAGASICVAVTSNYATSSNPYVQGLQLEEVHSGYEQFYTPASGSASCFNLTGGAP